MKTVIVINNDQMGQGDRTLGRKILGACLRKLLPLEGLDAVVLYNAGVKLGVKDSELAADLAQLFERGVDVLLCGTCLEHFGLEDQLVVDRVSNMDEILATLWSADRVITL